MPCLIVYWQSRRRRVGDAMPFRVRICLVRLAFQGSSLPHTLDSSQMAIRDEPSRIGVKGPANCRSDCSNTRRFGGGKTDLCDVWLGPADRAKVYDAHVKVQHQSRARWLLHLDFRPMLVPGTRWLVSLRSEMSHLYFFPLLFSCSSLWLEMKLSHSETQAHAQKTTTLDTSHHLSRTLH